MTGLYVRAYDVDLGDVAKTSEPYPSFDAFFTRPLRPGARHLSDDAVVCPADGKLVDRGPIESDSRIVVKGRPYSVAELVGNEADAAALAGGTFAVIYLSPRDYHRVHSPVAGTMGRVHGISGDLYPVNSIGERHVPDLFVRNQRVAMFIDTPAFGRVAVVMVGAMIVGRISVTALHVPGTPLGIHRLSPPVPVARGDEIGMFHLGSTVVVLGGRGLAFSRAPGPVLYGESLLS